MSSSLLFPLYFVVQSLFDKEDEKVLEKRYIIPFQTAVGKIKNTSQGKCRTFLRHQDKIVLLLTVLVEKYQGSVFYKFLLSYGA